MNTMNVWIITTGSSDVQLTTEKNWNLLCDRAKEQQDNNKKLHFGKNIELTKSVVKPKGSDRPITRFLAPARAMGIVYGNAIAENVERYNELDFPLLNNFSMLLNKEKIIFDRIIVVVTDQTDLFTTPAEKNQIYCPYWQDTCTFEEIIKQYFQRFPHKVEKIQPEFLILKPDIENPDSASTRKPGLDDWNSVLKLVQEKIAGIKDIPEDATVYVSHQASTPAISSAIQFASLAKFGKQVQFLVSNVDDREHPADVIRSGEYLKGIKFQEAKALLDRHDYSGVKALLSADYSGVKLLSSYLTPEIEDLLNAAIKWNFAEFDGFAEAMTEAANKYSKENEWWQTMDKKVKARSKEWWWTAYESAYLAVVRLKQGNTVEAMFHSFRAVEGLLRKWADKMYPPAQGQEKKIQLACNARSKTFNRYGKGLYNALDRHYHNQHQRNIDSTQNEDIWKFGNVTFDKRNDLFHQLLGMPEAKVFEYWDTLNPKDWEARVLGCLNFIAEPKPFFSSLEEASLMFNVHKELEKAIARQ
jgi:hypothetical protein